MKDLETEFLFTCEKGMLLLRTSFSVAGHGKKAAGPGGQTPSIPLPGKKWAELCEFQAARTTQRDPALYYLEYISPKKVPVLYRANRMHARGRCQPERTGHGTLSFKLCYALPHVTNIESQGLANAKFISTVQNRCLFKYKTDTSLPYATTDNKHTVQYNATFRYTSKGVFKWESCTKMAFPIHR